MTSLIDRMFYDIRHQELYTISPYSNKMIVYRMQYPHLPGIPMEILKMDARAIQLFEEALKGGKETVYNIRIMVVGALAAGKSTLVKRLLGEYVKISERSSTEGIDVYTNCCHVSLSTHEWTRRSKDSEQDYKLQRLVKVLNENYQTSGRDVDSKPDVSTKQREINEVNPMKHVADDAKNIEVQDPSTGQYRISASSLKGETSSTLVDMTPQPVDNPSTKNDKMDPLREMLKLLQQNPEKAKQDAAKYAHLTMLDFAGQYVFYTTHQMFLSHRAIYLLVLDSSKDVSELIADDSFCDSQGKYCDLLEIWMNSIHSCALPVTEDGNSASSQASTQKTTPPPVILVGTHIDQIPQDRRCVAPRVRRIDPSVSPVQEQREYCRKQGQKYLKKIRKSLRDKPTKVHLVDEDFAIDNTVVDNELGKLKEKIVEVASQMPYWGEKIPTCWFLLEQQLMRLKDAGVKVITHSAVEQLNKAETVQIKDSEELELFLKYLHETGTVIYFSIEILRDIIILEPKWMIDALKSLINSHPNLPTIPAITEKWYDFREKGILSTEIVDAIWTPNEHPELHAHKDHLLRIMEQFNIIAKPRSFDENVEKVEKYYLAPCILRQECLTEVTSLVQNFRTVSTADLCCVFKGKYLPPPIFHRLIAACIARWPVAKKRGTSENLIFCGCCVFDIDLFHRLTLYFRSHIIYARITRLVIDDVRTLDAQLCTRVKNFINDNLTKITSYLCQNLQYDLQTQYPQSGLVSGDGKRFLPTLIDMWFAEEGSDSDVQITHEHMNHARLCIALATVCGKAMKEILHTQVPSNYPDIYQAILANKVRLTQGRGKLDNEQTQLVFPQGQITVSLDQFDISLLYKLIRNVSSVHVPSNGWGTDPQDHPQRDTSLGASVERIRSYRNHISGHSPDAMTNSQDFQDYWKKFEDVLHDIDTVFGRQAYTNQLEKQRKHVFSIYEAY